MREHVRAIAMLVRTAWRVDRWRTLGLTMEPIAFLRVPLFAWLLKVMADGAMQSDPRLLAAGAAGITAVAGLGFAALWMGTHVRIRLTEAVGFALNRDIAALAAAAPGLEHHERADFQDRLELLRQGHGVLGNALNSLLVALRVMVFSVGTLVALALVAPWLLLIVPFALPALPIAAVQQRWFARAEASMAEPSRRARHLQELTTDRAAGMELRVFGMAPEVLRRFERVWLESRQILVNAGGRAALLNTAGDLVFAAGFAATVAFMLVRAGRGQATVGEVVMAVFLIQQVRAAVVDPVQSIAGLGEPLRAAGRMLWLKDYVERAAAAAGGSRPAPERLEQGIVFENVSFRYPGTERWALRNVSFRIPAGAVIALVGENGAGKTTVVKLLCRMYEPTEGRILVDGTDLAEIEIGAWRRRLTAAFQDFARLEFTAQHAVGLGDLPRMDDEPAVHAALDRAGASGVLRALPQGTATQLAARWEGGVDLSTGQWQRLALGRALMRQDPLVVFFDEPTASLDAMAEHALFERYAGEARSGSARGAVTVLVSHRFSTVRSAGLILVVVAGGVAELGSHDELLLRGGLYAELYQMQARAYA
jgi:ATP-binding cassette subfamily B protein